MNKSKVLLLTMMLFGITSVQAARKTQSIAIKHDAAGETALPVQEPAKTLEEQHMVVPIGKRQKMTQEAFCKDIRNTVANELKNLAETSNGNLTIGEPTTKAPRLAVFLNPETNQSTYIHYTPSKPVKIINNKEEHIHKTHELFENLANKYESCGLVLKSVAGRPPANWLAWFETDLGGLKKTGSQKVYLILEDKKPTIDQVTEYEASMKQ